MAQIDDASLADGCGLGDVWSEWLLHLRHGDDPKFEGVLRQGTIKYADRILDHTDLAPGMTLVDVGTGDGLVAFRAIERIGPSIQVFMTDVSPAMIRHAQVLAAARRLSDQCRFVVAKAERLIGIGDKTADALTTRSVLAYVPDKASALQEFRRVLKPGGRLSIAEPIPR